MSVMRGEAQEDGALVCDRCGISVLELQCRNNVELPYEDRNIQCAQHSQRQEDDLTGFWLMRHRSMAAAV
jgi:DNA-directed RNA polymerase subunit RPC12/RpoP